jgi:hypothetical protein
VLDNEQGLIAALALLPGLEHLSIMYSDDSTAGIMCIPLCEVLPGLQQLTYLELDFIEFAVGTDCGTGAEGHDAAPVSHPASVQLQHLSTLTRPADLRLQRIECRFTASMLSGVQTLTRLQLAGPSCASFDPAVLAGKTLLQHLELQFQALLDRAPGAQLLAQLQLQHELTCLILRDSCKPQSMPQAAAFAALTASSKLQHLDVSGCSLPTGVWQHVFPAGRQLPRLRVLSITTSVFDGTRLVSGCPALQCLAIHKWDYGRGLLPSLQWLSSLHTLHLEPFGPMSEGLQGVVKLTRLRELRLMDFSSKAEGLLLQLT